MALAWFGRMRVVDDDGLLARKTKGSTTFWRRGADAGKSRRVSLLRSRVDHRGALVGRGGHHQNHPFGETFGDDARRVETMIEAIVASARLAREVDERNETGDRESGMATRRKEDDSLVTVADFAIQRLVSDTLHGALGEFLVGDETCPAEGDVFDRVEELVAKYTSKEEKTSEKTSKDSMRRDYSKKNYFVLDPIDGTKAFAKPLVQSKAGRFAFTEQYCIGLSYHDGKDGTVLASCLAAPRWERGTGVLLVAVKGKGCFSKELFTAAKGNDVSKSRWKRSCLLSHLCTIRVAISESDVGKQTTLNAGWKVPESSLEEIAYGSGSLIKYVAIAVNACDAFVHYKPWTHSMNVWDHAAGVLCCEEAGAIVTDGVGNKLSLRKELKGAEEDDNEGNRDDLRRVFSPEGKAIVVANDESLHKEILRAHNAAVELINDFSAGLGR